MRGQKCITMATRKIVGAGVYRRPLTWLSLAGAVLALAGSFAHTARGDVLVVGSVSPVNDPFTPDNEGLPPLGNEIDFFVPLPPVAEDQTNFEGLEDIIVGVNAPGSLTINNGSFLRYQDLIIGDAEIIGMGADEQNFVGEGLMRIVGVGAYYNNDPTILPAGFPTYEEFGSLRDPDTGYDLYVGRDGYGIMEITGGARAEIQDAVFVASGQLSTGDLIVDGIGSHLGTGGFSNDVGVDEFHQLLVGLLGVGTMTISNGGRVMVRVDGDSIIPNFVASVIGGQAALGDDEPRPGGQGTVTVTGPLSRWTMQGTLQVGGFHNEDGTFGPELESEGDNLIYENDIGIGTLIVADDALVNLIPIDPIDEIQTLTLAIGRLGTVVLEDGRINVGALIGDPDSAIRNDQMRVVNDGTIRGGGRIDTGIFRNRFLGIVEVGIGEHLIINSGSEFEDVGTDAAPLINWGVIRVFGNRDFQAEFEVERTAEVLGSLPAPFQNRQLTIAPLAGRAGGLIHVQHGTLRFRSGLENQGALAFTDGQNRVEGNIVNLPDDGTFSDGVISVVGNDTHVVFEDNLVNGGVLAIGGNTAGIDVLGDFINTGTLNLVVSESAPGPLNVVGDAILSGTLEVSLFGPSPLHGDTFGVLSATGELIGIFDTQVLPPLSPDLGWLVDYNLITDTVSLRALSLASVVGADFNGDGFVDLLDLAIWNMFVGITSGATPLQGDADGDGDVDGDDFLLWQMQLGPVPGAGSGTGAGGALAAVPEPTCVLLFLPVGAALLAFRRRQH
jgi:T5SS/PEP-CTERM-associated repeat protein